MIGPFTAMDKVITDLIKHEEKWSKLLNNIG
jgi:hypothetical protein